MANQAKTVYQLSRIYAEGWNYARTDKNTGISSNPYRTEPERTRWNEGYAKASG